MISPGNKFKQLREEKEITIEQIANEIGISKEYCFDLEESTDLKDNISIRDLFKICRLVGTQPGNLFFGKSGFVKKTEPQKVVDLILEYIIIKKINMSEFEQCIGWETDKLLKNPNSIYEWNIEGLMAICDTIGIDFRGLLMSPPELP